MALEQFKVLTPAPDGATVLFSIGMAYQPGSTTLYANGINQLHRGGNPWSETDPATGLVTTAWTPETGDQLFLRFVDTTDIDPTHEITEIEGVIDARDDLVGQFAPLGEMDGALGALDTIVGELGVLELEGVLDVVDQLEGEIVVVDEAGLSLIRHRTVRHLIHFIDEGPGGGFTSGAYKTVVGGLFPTLVTWYTAGARKIVEQTIERSAGPATKVNPTPVIWRMYDEDGTTLLCTVQDDITYSGAAETGRVRTIS